MGFVQSHASNTTLQHHASTNAFRIEHRLTTRYGLKTTFCTFSLSKRSYPSTASERGIILSNMKLQDQSVSPKTYVHRGLTRSYMSCVPKAVLLHCQNG